MDVEVGKNHPASFFFHVVNEKMYIYFKRNKHCKESYCERMELASLLVKIKSDFPEMKRSSKAER